MPLSGQRATGLLASIGVVVVATAVVAAPRVPTFVRTPVAAVAAAVVLWQLILVWRGDRLEAFAVSGFLFLASLVVLGFALDALPFGLTRLSWSVGIGVVEVAGLLVLPAPPGRSTSDSAFGPPSASRPPSLQSLWYIAAAAITALSLIVAIRSTNQADTPPLQLSATSITATQGDLLISASRATHPLKLSVSSAGRRTTISAHIVVTAEHPVRETILLQPGVRESVTLRDMTTHAVLRSLVITAPLS